MKINNIETIHTEDIIIKAKETAKYFIMVSKYNNGRYGYTSFNNRGKMEIICIFEPMHERFHVETYENQ